jgi:O-acetyl-ADP-ribose deacetylase (regulator of RNase III)
MINLIQGDITKMDVDAIVNAANTSLLGGSGVDGAIHKMGGKQILEECIKIRNRQGGCKVGESVITSAGKLSAKFVIHTVGPVWNGGGNNEELLLSLSYENSLKIALENDIKTIAFPNISTGIYSFPKKLAAEIAIRTAMEFIRQTNSTISILFVCFDRENFDIYQNMLSLVYF